MTQADLIIITSTATLIACLAIPIGWEAIDRVLNVIWRNHRSTRRPVVGSKGRGI